MPTGGEHWWSWSWFPFLTFEAIYIWHPQNFGLIRPPLHPCHCPIYTTYLYCPNIRSHNADFIFEWPLSQITLSGNECSSSHFCLSPDEVNFRKRRTEKVQPTTPWRPRLNNLLSKYLNQWMEPMFCAAERFGNRWFVCFLAKIVPFAKGIKGILIFHVA